MAWLVSAHGTTLWPSGGALAAASRPIMPPALPVGKATIIRSGQFGKACARAAGTQPAVASPTSAALPKARAPRRGSPAWR